MNSEKQNGHCLLNHIIFVTVLMKMMLGQNKKGYSSWSAWRGWAKMQSRAGALAGLGKIKVHGFNMGPTGC